MPATGEFEICEGDSLVVSEGEFMDRDIYPAVNEVTQRSEVTEYKLTREEVYKLLRLRGYDYGPTFQGISNCSQSGELVLVILYCFCYGANKAKLICLYCILNLTILKCIYLNKLIENNELHPYKRNMLKHAQSLITTYFQIPKCKMSDLTLTNQCISFLSL